MLARAKLRVLLIEANDRIGGGARSGELTLPGFVHDINSAVHPLGIASPFFRELQLERYGLRWIHPDYPLAHPFDDGTAAALLRSVLATALELGADGPAYEELFQPLTSRWRALLEEILRPPLRLPRHPFLLARFGVRAVQPASVLARRFRLAGARALFAGQAAHSGLRLDAPGSGAYGLILGLLGHVAGWPFPAGGAQAIADALAACFREHGGEIVTGRRLKRLEDAPSARVVLLDLTPRQLLQLAPGRLPGSYRRQLERYRYGPAAFKLDFALSGPIPWTAPECRSAGTVHLGGTYEAIAFSERQIARGGVPERPFLLLAQPSLFDRSRAPAGKHTAWCYCHVPNGCTADMTSRMEAQIERFAPGFRDLILARSVMSPATLEAGNANLIGGDVNGGSGSLWQLAARPILSPNPYRTVLPGVYLCSASTPPGGGVHGMCGYHAARLALSDAFGLC